MSEYKTTGGLKYDGVNYEKGATIELNNDVAKALLADGTIVAIDAEVAEAEVAAPQPAVNTVVRKGDDVESEPEVKPGVVEPPLIGGEAETPEEKEAREKREAEGWTVRTVTLADLEANPALVEAGVKEGDEVELPPAKDESTGL